MGNCDDALAESERKANVRTRSWSMPSRGVDPSANSPTFTPSAAKTEMPISGAETKHRALRAHVDRLMHALFDKVSAQLEAKTQNANGEEKSA
jgi:hypothetical protein